MDGNERVHEIGEAPRAVADPHTHDHGTANASINNVIAEANAQVVDNIPLGSVTMVRYCLINEMVRYSVGI